MNAVRFAAGDTRAKRTARYALAAFFILAGISHFAATESFAAIVPPFVPAPETVVRLTGALEIVLGLALAARAGWHTAPVGLALAAYCLAVLPANVEMALRPDLSLGLPDWLLWLRVALQFPLIALIVWATRRRTRKP